MKNRKLEAKEFVELEDAINMLKQAEVQLNELNASEAVFGSEMASVRAKLREPDMVAEVEKEIDSLRKLVDEHGSALDGGTTYVPPVSPEFAFPRELEGSYYDVAVIGRGGFAKVFRARRKTDGTEVAVKIPLALDAETGKSFISEITTWKSLSHRNIVDLYDFNILPIPFLQMELCQRSLNDIPMPLSMERAASLAFHITEGLRYAHSKNTVHRDLKPHNILLQGEVPKIVDWGMSKVMTESKSTVPHTFSIYWAAPEQVSPQTFGKPDYRTDIYQLGAIMYQLVTGNVPFEGDSVTEIVGQIIADEPKQASIINPAAKDLDPVIMKCLQKEMSDRYQDMAEIQKDLAEYLQLEYKDSLSKSMGDISRSGYYCAELCLVYLMREDLAEALKYARDLSRYASEVAKNDLLDFIGELEFRMKENTGVTGELIERAAIILHHAKLGK